VETCYRSVRHPALVVVLVVTATVANVALASLNHALSVPLYFDSLFTFVVTFALGLVPGMVVAVATNGVLALFQMVAFPLVVCHLLTVVGCWLTFRSLRPSLTAFLVAGLVSGLSNGIAGSVVSYFLFEGVTKLNPIDDLVLGLVVAGQSLGGAVFWSGLVTNLVDKLLSAVVAFYLTTGLVRGLYKINPRFLANTSNS